MPSTESTVKEKIDPINDPDRLGLPIYFDFNPDTLPSSGKTAKPVWSGDWWPHSEGGTTSAMKKYDQATGSQAEAWERASAQGSADISWAGHCNGLAGAGMHEKKPRRPVVYKGVTFKPSDIEALLVEKWQGTAGITLVGKRCKTTPTFDANGRIVNSDCRDFNPGSFHILLGNVLGKERLPFVIDISSGEQVWNYPVVSYESKTEVIDQEEALRLTSQESTYAFTPTATQFMKVETRVVLATGTTKRYSYVLEGEDGEIVGGEWIGLSRKDHPDFAWYTREPTPANPHLDVQVIDRIASESY